MCPTCYVGAANMLKHTLPWRSHGLSPYVFFMRPPASQPSANAQGIAPFGQDICLLACSSPGKAEVQSEGPSSGGAEGRQEGVQAGTQRPEVKSQSRRQCKQC